MKFSFFNKLLNKFSKKSPAEENEGSREEPQEVESNEDTGSINDKPKRNLLKNIKTSPLLRKIITASAFCIILLLGVIAGLMISPSQETSNIYGQGPVIIEQYEQEREQRTGPEYRALDPVAVDWGITPDELILRINITLDRLGIRGDRIVRFHISENEFRHSFASALLMLGELSDANNVRLAAIFFDPALDPVGFPLAISLIRALIAATDPSLTREEISDKISSLGITLYGKTPPRQAELRHNKFIFRVWSVAGSAFVFTVSPD